MGIKLYTEDQIYSVLTSSYEQVLKSLRELKPTLQGLTDLQKQELVNALEEIQRGQLNYIAGKLDLAHRITQGEAL